MKLSSILILIVNLNIYANVYPQNVRLENAIENQTIKDILKLLENKSDYRFFYSDDYPVLNKVISVSAQESDIYVLLNQIFNDTPASYEILDDNVVVISPFSRQTIRITGTVSDDSGETMPGVNVLIKGTGTGITTDVDGRFSIDVPNTESVLVFSFVGYHEQEIPVGEQRMIQVIMVESSTEIEEVVVVGYGVQKKETMVGAVSQVGNKALMQSGTASVTNAIAGKLSGVLTMQQSGEPGNDNAEIIIRGVSSWNGSQPLVLVDGVERDFKDLDPNEINTISILKDASATAVFGARGANGVLIVTTKRGVEGKPKLDISASFGMEKATNIPDHIDSYTTMKMLNVARMNEQQFTELIPEYVLEEYRNPSSRLNALRYPNVNWFKEVTRPFAPTATANVNVTGGTSFVKYFASLGYTHQGSYFKGEKDGHVDSRFWNNRFNYRTNLDFNVSKSTLLSFNIGGEVSIKNQPTIGNIWWTLYGTSPARFPTYFPSWLLEEYPDQDYPDDTGIRYAEPIGEYMDNPYTVFNQRAFNRYLETKLFTDVMLKQDLDFLLKGLSIRGKVSLSTYYRNLSLTSATTNNYPQYQFDYEKAAIGENPWFRQGQGDETYKMPPLAIGIGGLQSGYYSDLYYEFSLDYNNTFGGHTVSVLALMNRQQKNNGTEFAYYNQGLVGRITYDYRNKYLAEVNVGYTGSERFAPGNRFGFFPSGAVGWVISEEQFFRDALPWISKMKIRYSDGLVGSDNTSSRWLYISDYFEDSKKYIREDKAANTRAQWEEARKQDLGVEIGLFDNSLHFSVDLFKERRTNMLLVPQSTPTLLGIQFKELNLGKMKKHGIEVEIEYKNTTDGGFYYFVRGMVGINENRILFKDDPPYAPDYQKQEGKPLEAQTSGVQLAGNGYFTSVDDIHTLPSPLPVSGLAIGDYAFLDYTADGLISSLDAYPIKGSLYPPVTYSFSAGFNYRNFEFSFLFQGNAGKYVSYNQNFEAEFTKGNYQVHASQLDYWTPTNTGANHSTLHFPGTGYIRNLAWLPATEGTGYTTYIEGRFWRKADYLKLKEVYIGYKFEPKWEKLPGISSINVYMTGNNLLTFTKLIEGDPERKDFSKGFYPQLLSVKLGMRVSF
ncbi:MAG: TonB-dependent receptor [Bacteroidales bacterium]|nr:TonB-dependent receptor [Bacteroidales bacterium]